MQSSSPAVQPKFIIILAMQVLIIIFAIFGITKITEEKSITPNVAIEKSSLKIPGLPEESAEYFASAIYSIVSKNSQNNFSVQDSGATVRESSIATTTFSKIEVNYASFIVDNQISNNLIA